MSAVFGLYNLNGQPVQPLLMEAMSTLLEHRGSNADGLWIEDEVALGHRTLWTTPESIHEVLPLSIQDDELTITADARIDNRRDLLTELGLDGNSPNTDFGDSEIILRCYQKWGEDCTSRLIGDFAFAIWDKRRRAIFCARDHYGVKQLNYFYSSSMFVFATEIKALWSVPGVPKAFNEVKVCDYLEGLFDDVKTTFYKGIYNLPAGFQMLIDPRGKRLKRYWQPACSSVLRLRSNEEYAECFREIFTEAVKCRMRSKFAVGSMLSGGLDSSSISCVAKNSAAEGDVTGFPTFSAIFDTVKESDEQPFIKAVVAQGGLDPSFLHADQISPLNDWRRICWHQDEPLSSFNLYLNWGIYRLAKKKGVRVILDGFDGDTAVSHGTGYLGELARSGRWIALARQLKQYGKTIDAHPLSLMWQYFYRYRVKRVLAASTLLKLAERQGKNLFVRRRKRSADSRLPESIMRRTFVSAAGINERHRYLKGLRGSPPVTEREDHLSRINWGVMQHILRTLDRSAAAFGIEVRFPFWDVRVIDFCLSLPPDQKIQDGWTRFILRNAMEGIIPEAVQWRNGKGNMGHAFRHGFLRFESRRIRQTFNNSPGKISHYTSPDYARQARQLFDSGKSPSDEELISIWKYVTLSLWLENTNFSTKEIRR